MSGLRNELDAVRARELDGLRRLYEAETSGVVEVAELVAMPYDAAERAWKQERITDEQWLAYQCVWRRSAPRLSDIAAEHDRCEGMCGCLAPRPEGMCGCKSRETRGRE